MPDKLVSFLIVSRGRFDELLKSINSIADKAADPKRVEVVLRFDADDYGSISRMEELPTEKIDINTIIGERYGYEFLHKYVNEICKETKGEFLAWWNDDCYVESPNYDNIMAEYVGKIVCFYPNNKKTGSGNIFPVISRKIFEILGHFAKSQQVDTWQYVVSSRAGIEVKRDDLVFIHNREQEYVSDPDRKKVLKRTHKVWVKSDKQITEDAQKIKRYIKEQKKKK